MPYYEFIWTERTIAHLAEHEVSPADFEQVVRNSESIGISRSSGLPAAWGYTQDGRYMIAVFEEIDEVRLLPVTAYEVPERRRRS